MNDATNERLDGINEHLDSLTEIATEASRLSAIGFNMQVGKRTTALFEWHGPFS